MDEITFTEKEIAEAFSKVLKGYAEQYTRGLMTFPEYSIIENVFVNLHNELESVKNDS